MRIDALTLEGFRNYRRAALDFDPSCNVIYGENAQGKTNLLEAIVYLSCGKSPRARTDRELLGFESERTQLVGHIFSRERAFETEITLARGRRRKMTVNGVPAKNGAALSDVLHTVFFSPEDLFLIRDGAAARRRFMDLSLCQLRPRYAEALTEYTRLHEHKTRILRDSEEYPQLLADAAGLQRAALPGRRGADPLPGAVLPRARAVRRAGARRVLRWAGGADAPLRDGKDRHGSVCAPRGACFGA